MGRLAKALSVPILFCSMHLHAQTTSTGSQSSEDYDAAWRRSIPDPASIAVPTLEFEPTPSDVADYDKYYYFNRPDTDFPTALADLRECDGLSRGLLHGYGYVQPNYTDYTTSGIIAGAVGNVVANALAVAIFGSAEKRRVRRINMRRCMHFKGYGRYGLRKDLWTTFNFEEGLGTIGEVNRQKLLFQQAKVASGARPQAAELGI